MVEDITIGVAIFFAFVVLAAVGRKLNFAHADIWAAS
jgi:hypothetical protein